MKAIDGGKAYAKPLAQSMVDVVFGLDVMIDTLEDATGEIASDRERIKAIKAELEQLVERYY